MRGSPVLQTIVLLVVMLLAGFAGERYLHSASDRAGAAPVNEVEKSATAEEMVDAEVEFIFSTTPKFYTLKQAPLSHDGEPQQLLTEDELTENPAYGDISIPPHQTVTYWLDVTWAEEPADGQRHFVQMRISPNYGETKEVAYSTTTSIISQTLDYSSGGEHDDE
ncbi:hypothetical protein JIN77_10500 [Verrucomicrobiaceae bacterium R5-34]|uniref:Uncharacterized protein n=1 Tax=Oceaniferula flava TaxID=2800421 RepID=A0AAE2VED4_9BACT|nr:hypothetical protein [Oceaniferula flavus]MBK1831158.1 hypothetical protein [Verrucomicrobiaceae bacterium R5-34]MBK1855674.1 hypothetical protein [Oceaniferula flavus]MBM1136980.1 hypothetical protein [Oceaniferula flavus]